jgi:hypothetical protein
MLALGAGDAAASTLIVDDDRQQCRNATFNSINLAVLAAAPGDEIKVCPGLYSETVLVNRPDLRLWGASRGGDTRGGARNECFDPTAMPEPDKDAIVQPPPAVPLLNGFDLQQDDIRLEGFVIQGARIGIVMRNPFSGYEVRDNLSQANLTGLNFDSSGASESRVEDNCFRENTTNGAQSGPGLVGTSNIRVEHNSFHRNGAGVVGRHWGPATRLEHNRSVEDGVVFGNGFVYGFARDSSISYNEFQDSSSLGRGAIGDFAGGVNTNMEIRQNKIRGGANGLDFGLVGSNLNLDASYNDIRGGAGDGIIARTGASVVNSVLSHNVIEEESRDGIRLEAQNLGNTVEFNVLRNNGEHDCHDDSIGPFPPGVANLWRKNQGETENRPGLCRGEAP